MEKHQQRIIKGNILGDLFGEILLQCDRVDNDSLQRALRIQEGDSSRVGEILVRMGVISYQDVAQTLAKQLGLQLLGADEYPELPILEEQVSVRFLKEARVIPIFEDSDRVTLAIVDPLDQYTENAFRVLTNKEVRLVVAAKEEFDVAYERLYGTGKSAMGQIVDGIETIENDDLGDDIQHLKDLASEAPVIRLVGLVMRKALEARASDIHIEPFESRLFVRYRIDGVIHEQESPPRKLTAAIISRIKIMANLDIAERRLPQDGRIRLKIAGKEIDLRVSTVPTMHGESVVMRILDKGGVPLDFEKLGFDPDIQQTITELLLRPHGILLVTGPTGSGKTTTLYTALQTLNTPDKKILTVEDPVEYQLEGVNQIQVKSQIGLTFANALRSIVRQDPDVIMIGEIRDLETAQIAVQSALTGHLVLSTLHTNDAASTVNRLLDMGMEDYLLTSTVIGIQAQRLVRTLCPKCRESYIALPEVVEEFKFSRFTNASEIILYRPVGCQDCAGTGFTGRISIMEIMLMTDSIRSLIMRHANSGEIQQAAMAGGMLTMYDNGLRKVLAGITTIEEVLRVTREV